MNHLKASKADTGGSGVQGQPGLQRGACLQNKLVKYSKIDPRHTLTHKLGIYTIGSPHTLISLQAPNSFLLSVPPHFQLLFVSFLLFEVGSHCVVLAVLALLCKADCPGTQPVPLVLTPKCMRRVLSCPGPCSLLTGEEMGAPGKSETQAAVTPKPGQAVKYLGEGTARWLSR